MTVGTTRRPIAVINGGGAGIGRATVRESAGAGYDVAVLARGKAGVDAPARDVEAAGSRCLPISVDVADESAVDAATDRVEAELGPIDVRSSTCPRRWRTARSRRSRPTASIPSRPDQDAPRWGSSVFEF